MELVFVLGKISKLLAGYLFYRKVFSVEAAKYFNYDNGMHRRNFAYQKYLKITKKPFFIVVFMLLLKNNKNLVYFYEF